MRRILLVPLLLLAVACSDDDEVATPTTIAPAQASDPVRFVLSGQGNDLVAYSRVAPYERHLVVSNATDDPEHGRDINGQLCFDPDDATRFVAGEDTDQEGAGDPGWGIFELTGEGFDDLGATQVAKLVPEYQPLEVDIPDNYGCGFLPGGRIVTTDIGNKAAGPPNGQLIVWFPPFDLDPAANAYCVVDADLATPQQILVRGDDLLVAEARRPGVVRYPIEGLPTSPDDCTTLDGEPFIASDDANRLLAPNGIAEGPDGDLYVSSVPTGVISRFSADGAFEAVVLAPPAGEELGVEPYSTGSPLGLAVEDDGTIWFADLGLVADPEDGLGPGDGTGTVRRLAPGSSTPEVVDEGLDFPDGVGLSPS